MLHNVNLGPVKRVLTPDQVGLKLYDRKHAYAAIRTCGPGITPCDAKKDDTGGVSGCAAQLTALIECLRAHDMDTPHVCQAEKAAAEQCRQRIKVQRSEGKRGRDSREISGEVTSVTMNQANRLLGWFPQPNKPRDKFDTCYTNYWIKYKYFKRRGCFRPED